MTKAVPKRAADFIAYAADVTEQVRVNRTKRGVRTTMFEPLRDANNALGTAGRSSAGVVIVSRRYGGA